MISEQNEKTSYLSNEVNKTAFLLTEKNKKYIETLKKLEREKQDKHTKLIEDIQGLNDINKKRIDICSIILRVMAALAILGIFYLFIPLIHALENWYNKNQFLCSICGYIITGIFILLGLKNKSIYNVFYKPSKFIVIFLVKVKLLKNIDIIINKLNAEIKTLSKEISNIQDEIDKALEV